MGEVNRGVVVEMARKKVPGEWRNAARGEAALDLAITQKEYVPGPPIQSRLLYTAGLIAAVPAAWPLARRKRRPAG